MSNSKSIAALLRLDDPQTNPSSSLASISSKFYPAPLRWTGFTKPSNLVLFSFTAGVFAIFSAFQIRTLEQGNWMKPNPPGGPFWFKDGLLYLVMQLHLWSVIPAGVLLPLQFLPVMRRRYISLHRVSGRALFVLLLVGNITALTMARHSFGGTITTQAWVWTVAAMTAFSVYKAWTSILNLHIDQHRVWVLRTWSYACTILTLRIFMIVLAISIAKLSPNSYNSVLPCDEIIYMYQFVASPSNLSSLYSRYPACAKLDGSGSDVYVVVNATLGNGRLPEERAALMNMIFGVSGWIALVLHILLVEVYLSYNKEEDERLRKVSGVRRRAARYEVKED